MRTDKRASQKADKKAPLRINKRGVVGYSKKSALLEEAITHMNTGKYGRSSAALKELLALDPHNTEARRLFATLHLRLGSLVTARQAFESLANEAIGRQDYWLAESLLREYLAAGPRCVPFLELLAHVYQEKGDEMAAVGELGKAIEILRDDPDSENPRKAAQLYAKIRGLVPGSPVAIQLASLFDVQTGEIVFRPPTDESMLPTHDAAASLQVGATPVATEGAQPEVMPWEQIEDAMPAAKPLGASVSAPAELSEVERATELPAQVETRETETSMRVSELSAPAPETTHQSMESSGLPSIDTDPSTGMSNTSASWEQPRVHDGPSQATTTEAALQGAVGETLTQDPSVSATGEENARTSPMPWDQIADASVQILDAEPPPSPTVAPSSDSILSAWKEDVQTQAVPLSLASDLEERTESARLPPSMEPPSTDTSTAVPAPMPWDQVADAMLQIQEAESSPEPMCAPTVNSSLSDLSQDVENPLGHGSTGEGLPASVAPPESEPPFQPTADIPRAGSFSWTSVFDTAWKFAAGTTASSAPALSEGSQEAPLDSQRTQPEQAADPVKVNYFSTDLFLHSNPPFKVDSPPAAEPTGSDQVDLSSGQPDQLATDNSTSGEKGPAVAGSPMISVTPDLNPSYPIQAESTSADLPEFLAHSHSDEVPQAAGSPATPVSFSTVVDAQEIPEVEPIQPDSLEQSIPLEMADPESPPVSSTHAPDQVEETTAINEPFQAANAASPVADLPQEPAPAVPPIEVLSHWNTGEVAVQLHRPTAKKKKWEKESEESEPGSPMPAPVLETLSEKLSEAIQEWESTPVEAAAPPVVEEVAPPQPDMRPEWMQASAEITFSQPHATPREAWHDSSSDSLSLPQGESTPMEEAAAPREPLPACTVASSAVDVLFGSTGRRSHAGTQDRLAFPRLSPRLIARLHRARIGVSSFIGSCFSTTRSLTILAVAICVTTAVVAALGIGALGLVWMAMENPPSGLYQKLTSAPPRVITEAKKNGYLLLLGFDAPAGQDPIHVGYERKVEAQDALTAQACIEGEAAKGGTSTVGASAHVVKGWFRSADPVAQLKGQGGSINALAARESLSLARYKQWLTMPFDDWGYGQLLSPNCAQILLTHRLFILEGFSQDSATGLDRLESDAQSWRTALGQSKTLVMKMLAVTAVQDDVAMASGLLSRSELDGASVTRLSKMVRPLDQVEVSLRWPMQSHFVWATKSVPADLKRDKADDRPWYVSLVAGMQLPIQRRANAYAEYYEEMNKAVAAGRFTNLPKPSSFIRTPATSVMDYLANPVEHIVGIEPPPSWDSYLMRMMETDAQLRLVGLQAWLRRGPQDGDLLTRLAKAGQAYYDPFTGLPMLVDQRKGLIYSVGRDGKDQEGDRAFDIAVAVPSVSSSPSDNKRSKPTSQPK